MRKIDGKSRSVRELLSGTKYGIDYYQREYRWGTKQIQELLDDLAGKFLDDYQAGDERKAVKDYGHYFLGSIVLSHKSGTNFIIDGQQRLTSLTLLLIHLHNLQRELSVDQNVSLTNLIFSTQFGEKSFNLDVPDRKHCMDALFQGLSFDPTDFAPSVQTIVARHEDIRTYLSDEVVGDALPYFIDWLLESVHLIEITAYSDEDAYTIFETMNDRGLSLSLTDMLKGYLLSSITDADEQGACNEIWKRRVSELGTLGKEEDVDFFKTWFRAQHANSIRERKKNATNQAFERIGTEFHRWLREERVQVGLEKSDDFVQFVRRDFMFFSRQYMRIRDAAADVVVGLESIRYNAHRGFTLQHQLLLAALEVTDTPDVVDQKLRLVADFVDIVLARRIWNHRSIAYSNVLYWAFTIMRDIRCLPVAELSAKLLERLDEQPAFADSERVHRHQQNHYQIHHLLARMTHFVEAQCGVASTFDQYVSRSISKPYEIEHIWANKFERHTDEFSHPADFGDYRNRLGGLILLPRGFNQSFGAMVYSEKLEHYNAQNVLARSLHPACYENNPSFLRFLSESELSFKPHAFFVSADLDERQTLYREIAELLWSADRLKMPN